MVYKGAATFNPALVQLVKNGWLGKSKAVMLRDMNPLYEGMIDDIPELVKLDFSLLLQPRLDYTDQPDISKEQVRLMGACAIHYKMIMDWYCGSSRENIQRHGGT